MKRNVLAFFRLLSVFVMVLSCISKKEPLPPLTYSGDSPRIQDPLSAEDSKRHIQVPEGFEVTLYAAEPNIINPIAFTWDENGRLWVVQSQDYPHGLENEVGGDRITICEDTDKDGKADKFIDFATEQSLTTGIVKVKGGIIVGQAPNMVFLQDTDGDDKMDKSTVLFDGFGTWDTHAGPSSLRYGLDNHIWGAVGYSGFENTFADKEISFKMGVYRFSRNGSYFEPVGQFNNNTWGLGFNEHFEIFGSTANNNHCCYVGIPLRYYDYLKGDADWAINADFIQGHYEMPTATPLPVPLQQVDVRGGFTAAAGANFYTAKNYPEAYQNQMYVNEPTGHIVHLARVVRDGAGYKELKDGNIFASTDAWTAPVFSKTGPDGNLWVADWYNPVIQHNPDKRGMENQIWNDDKGEGNAHLNEHRDKRHGRIYIITHEDGNDPDIQNLDSNDGQLLLAALQSDNMFWRTTAQRLLVEENKTSLIPELLKMARTGIENPKDNTQYGTLHALWTLEGLGAYDTHQEALALVFEALSKGSFSTKKAAIALLPQTTKSSNALAASGLLGDTPLALRLDAMLKAGELPETNALYKQMEAVASDSVTAKDKWLTAALKIYRKEQNEEFVEPDKVRLILPAADQGQVTWRSTQKRPTDTWMNPNFDDSRWKRGKGLFGGEDSKDPQTPWTTSDIWLRADFILREPMVDPVLKIKNDDSCEIYINGLLVKTEEEVNGKYTYVKLPKETESYFKVGHNHIAVHAHDKGGKRYIDVGVGTVKAIQPDITFRLKTVNQKMAFDKTILRAKAGQVVKIVLDNTDQMPHNLVVLQSGTLAAFGERVDDYVKDPKAPQTGYVPNSRYVLGATEMLEPGDNGAVVFELPKVPGSYPFVCTFPGHWQMMQGAILVEAPGSYISEDPDAFASVVMGGGSSHDFEGLFGVADGKVLSNSGKNTVLYIENSATLAQLLKDNDLLMLTNNKPLGTAARKAIFTRVDQGMPLFIYHPSAWYNWEDWPRYNAELVGGGSRSHEKLQEFEVIVVKPEHPIMKGVPKTFRIVDELYRWEQDPEGAAVEVLAVGRGLESGAEFPVVWVVKHPKAKIVGNTLGHDERAHNLPAYKTLLANSLEWAKTRE